jgi:hypothetical protein
VAIPLLRVAQLSTSTFMNFSEVLHFKVDQSMHKHDFLTRLQTLNISVHLSVSEDFITSLQGSWHNVQKWKKQHGDSLHGVPLAILDLQDPIDEDSHGKHFHLHRHNHSSGPQESIADEKLFFMDEFALAVEPEDMHGE